MWYAPTISGSALSWTNSLATPSSMAVNRPLSAFPDGRRKGPPSFCWRITVSAFCHKTCPASSIKDSPAQTAGPSPTPSVSGFTSASGCVISWSSACRWYQQASDSGRPYPSLSDVIRSLPIQFFELATQSILSFANTIYL